MHWLHGVVVMNKCTTYKLGGRTGGTIVPDVYVYRQQM
jgi:hypothetical protein